MLEVLEVLEVFATVGMRKTRMDSSSFGCGVCRLSTSSTVLHFACCHTISAHKASLTRLPNVY